MLTDDQRQAIERALREEEERLVRSALDSLAMTMEGPTDSGRDSIDASTAEELLSTALRLRDREKKLLEKVQLAKERLAEGTIDVCEACGGEIGFRRLLARPVTTLCIECKEHQEEREHQGAEGEAPEEA